MLRREIRHVHEVRREVVGALLGRNAVGVVESRIEARLFATGWAHVIFVLGKRHELHAVFARLRLVGFQIERSNAETLLRMAERKGAAQNRQAHLLFSIHVIDQQIWAIGGIAEPSVAFGMKRGMRASPFTNGGTDAPRIFRRSIIAQTPRRRDFAFAAEPKGHMPAHPRKRKPRHPERRPKGYALWHTRKNSDAMRDKKARGAWGLTRPSP